MSEKIESFDCADIGKRIQICSRTLESLSNCGCNSHIFWRLASTVDTVTSQLKFFHKGYKVTMITFMRDILFSCSDLNYCLFY